MEFSASLTESFAIFDMRRQAVKMSLFKEFLFRIQLLFMPLCDVPVLNSQITCAIGRTVLRLLIVTTLCTFPKVNNT